ncbi:MAG: hypothetical protein HXX13_14815 [Bacteroidetes bacterium]|nr:hypothetical protein [Bacteroidota bacterium]
MKKQFTGIGITIYRKIKAIAFGNGREAKMKEIPDPDEQDPAENHL